jgi:hypothetical protein
VAVVLRRTGTSGQLIKSGEVIALSSRRNLDVVVRESGVRGRGQGMRDLYRNLMLDLRILQAVEEARPRLA